MDHLENFIKSFAAERLLQNRASKSGSFIEFVCLSSSMIDAQLRIGLILQKQLENRNRHIDDALIFQDIADSKISERTIYKMAYENGIIDVDLYKDLNTIYDKRNIIIHRFIISSFTYDDVLNTGMKYEKILEKVNACIYKLERKQITDNIGMTVEAPLPQNSDYYYNLVKDKIKNHLVLREAKKMYEGIE